ncbi:MAG: hypothetical protein AABX54_02520 [Nanoarchaeota archaeon]
MGSCKKASLVARVLRWQIPESLRKIISYGNQLNGMIGFCKRGRLKISEADYDRLEKAYGIIGNVMASRGVDLNYVPKRRVEDYIDAHRKRVMVM